MRLVVALLLTAVLAQAVPAQQDVWAEREAKASAALHEAEKLLELGRASEGLAALDELLTGYPGSGAEKWALLRRVEALYFLGRHDEAIALGQSLVDRYAKTEPILAAWAQCKIGLSYAAKEEWPNAIAALQATERMNDQDAWDRGPSLAARARLGEIYMHLARGQADPRAAAPVLGFSKNDRQASAASLAMARIPGNGGDSLR